MDSKLVEMHSKRVTQGERSRILWECFMEQLGLTYEATPKDVFERMAVVQKEYEESVHFFGEIMKQAHKSDSQTNQVHTSKGNFESEKEQLAKGRKTLKKASVSVNHK